MAAQKGVFSANCTSSPSRQCGQESKMADGGEIENPESVDVAQGDEPGASRNSIILASDSYEDLAYCFEKQLNVEGRARLPSGPITELTGSPEAAKGQGEDTRSTASHEGEVDSTSSAGSSARNTPSSEVTTQKQGQDETAVNNVPTSVKPHVPSKDTVSQSNDIKASKGEVSPTEEEPDYLHSKEWQRQHKHVFILSEAGKPIYSRHGNEDKLVTIFGVMQALVSFVQDSKDAIRCIVAGHHKFVFLVREHLILVGVVNSQYESAHQLVLQLTYMYNQMLSVLTLSQLERIFKQRRNYDLRRLLTGAEKFFDNLMNMMDSDPSCLLGAVRCLPLESSVRDIIAQSIVQHAKVKDLVFAVIVAKNQLVTLVRMKKYFLHPLDLHLIFNLVSASESFKGAESWTPICLPKFDSGGYLHAHISYLDEDCEACLLLLTVDRDVFFTLSECKQKITQRLIKYKCLTAITESIRRTQYSIGQVGIPDLRHFLYKSRSTSQYTSPEYEAPYNTEKERDRLFGLYQYLHQRIHSPTRPLKILFHVGPYETLLGWVTSGFELYAVFGPLVTKPVAINSVTRLLKWIKKEEDKLFILSSPTF